MAWDVEVNRKKGALKKTVKTPTGAFELATPGDQNGSFDPHLVKKHQTTLSDKIERRIIRYLRAGYELQRYQPGNRRFIRI
nr:transposase [Serratia symbiotica]